MAGTGRDPFDGGAEQRERGTAISFIGLAILVLDLLIVFFAPAGFRIGRHALFTALIVILAVVGLALVLVGRGQRRAST